MKHIFRTLLCLLLALAMTAACAGSCLAAEADKDPEIDYHRYSPLMLELCGERRIEQACQVIDAFFAGEESVVLQDYEVGDAPQALYLAGLMCPVFAGTVFTGWDYIDGDRLHWKNLCTAEEVADLTQQFEDACSKYLDPLQPGDSDLVKAISIYYDFTLDHEYDYDLQQELDAAPTSEDQTYISSALRTMLEGTGTCNEFSTCYAFLCIQAGLNVINVGSYGEESGGGAHEWNIVEIDGNYYYCDTTWDLADADGQPGLTRFGMTADDRTIEGGYTMGETSFHVNGSELTLESLGLDDDRFSYLHGWSFLAIADLTIDHSTGTVTVTCWDGYTCVIE